MDGYSRQPALEIAQPADLTSPTRRLRRGAGKAAALPAVRERPPRREGLRGLRRSGPGLPPRDEALPDAGVHVRHHRRHRLRFHVHGLLPALADAVRLGRHVLRAGVDLPAGRADDRRAGAEHGPILDVVLADAVPGGEVAVLVEGGLLVEPVEGHEETLARALVPAAGLAVAANHPAVHLLRMADIAVHLGSESAGRELRVVRKADGNQLPRTQAREENRVRPRGLAAGRADERRVPELRRLLENEGSAGRQLRRGDLR